MLQQFEATHRLDEAGKPAGGIVKAEGLSVYWQNGPLGRGEDRKEPNGCFVETLIAVASDRLDFYNNNGFRCVENENAIACLNAALVFLNERTARREDAGVEGTHEGN
jgi:hypothetical protein